MVEIVSIQSSSCFSLEFCLYTFSGVLLPSGVAHFYLESPPSIQSSHLLCWCVFPHPGIFSHVFCAPLPSNLVTSGPPSCLNSICGVWCASQALLGDPAQGEINIWEACPSVGWNQWRMFLKEAWNLSPGKHGTWCFNWYVCIAMLVAI